MNSDYRKRMENAARKTWLDHPVTLWIFAVIAVVIVGAIVTHALDWWNFPGEDTPIVKRPR
ncbi:hypothetical protein [Xylophilus sp. GOD-11R]|uniref:hypothetical protein n=1 Tax=Xylophilus sp. GOD-11R TaxID=3089814 RepID=UPI00298C5246|nr:hypothetical protein [Xylophilus sp. GOD-11R]WPB58722.1 hypothetical protein R9X41_08815 [Xylophilus sp. GOD-11R]